MAANSLYERPSQSRFSKKHLFLVIVSLPYFGDNSRDPHEITANCFDSSFFRTRH